MEYWLGDSDAVAVSPISQPDNSKTVLMENKIKTRKNSGCKAKNCP